MSVRLLSSRTARGAIVAMGAALAAVACTGTADAYWSGAGSGSGSAATATMSLSAGVTSITGLYPGATVPVTVTLTNTSTQGSLTITALTQAGTATIQTPGNGACTPTVVTFASGTLPSGIAPNQSASATGSVTMTTAAANGCQGAVFAIPLTATAKTS